MEDCDPVVPKALYGWNSLVVDPEWVHCMGKALSISIYGIAYKDLKPSLMGTRC